MASTNARAVEVAAGEALDCPFLVLAASQTAGRGRAANTWWSAPGALTFSLVVDAAHLGMSPAHWPLVGLTAGLAVGRAIGDLMPETAVALKWPNDVYLLRRKVAGILVEIPDPRSGRLVIGVGLNVNNLFHNAPPDVRSIGLSMREACARTFELEAVLDGLLAAFDYWLRALGRAKNQVLNAWRDSCLLRGKRVVLRNGSSEVAGYCAGIDDEGQLIVTGAEGMRSHRTGTVVWFE